MGGGSFQHRPPAGPQPFGAVLDQVLRAVVEAPARRVLACAVAFEIAWIEPRPGLRLWLGDVSGLPAALSAWKGALVFLDPGDLAPRLAANQAPRLAPGDPASLAWNPLDQIRCGAGAFADARRLAAALAPTLPEADRDALALVMIEQLATQSPNRRTLAALRDRLAQAETSRSPSIALDIPAWPAIADADLLRAAHRWRHTGRTIAPPFVEALQAFADPRIAAVTDRTQLDLADLVCGEGARVLRLEPPARDRGSAAPLIDALLTALFDAEAARRGLTLSRAANDALRRALLDEGADLADTVKQRLDRLDRRDSQRARDLAALKETLLLFARTWFLFAGAPPDLLAGWAYRGSGLVPWPICDSRGSPTD